MIEINDFDGALKYVEFYLWNSIVEHKKAEAPQVIIDELNEAHGHIVKAMEIIDRDDL
tara:strand:- start:568 stop:741 length:174 start_codon:yes stop_codon:yes gene_type:complete